MQVRTGPFSKGSVLIHVCQSRGRALLSRRLRASISPNSVDGYCRRHVFLYTAVVYLLLHIFRDQRGIDVRSNQTLFNLITRLIFASIKEL